MARLFYISLWCEADREGRMQWKPRTFKMRYFPADNCDIDALAREIIASGLVVLYGDGLAYIPTFHKHQHINPREAASSIKSIVETDACPTRDDASVTVNDAQVGREGRERKGKEGVYDASFDAFWKAYPRKDAKTNAVKAWKKVKAEEVPAVMAGLEAAKKSKDWLKEDGQFIPYPASWLNARRWEDEGVTNRQAANQDCSGVVIDSQPQSGGTTTNFVFSAGEKYVHHFNGSHYWKRDGMNCSQPDWILARDHVEWDESGWSVAA